MVYLKKGVKNGICSFYRKDQNIKFHSQLNHCVVSCELDYVLCFFYIRYQGWS